MKSGKNFADKKPPEFGKSRLREKAGKRKNQGEEKAKSADKQAQAKILRHGRGGLAMRNGLPAGAHKAGLRAYLRRRGEKKWRGQASCLGHRPSCAF